MKLDPSLQNYHDILMTRVLICHAGLNRPVDMSLEAFGHFTEVAAACAQGLNPDTELEEAGWNIYVLDPDERCPLERVGQPSWLVEGVCTLTGDDNFSFDTIAPDAYVKNLRNTAHSIAPLLTPGIMHIIDVIEEAADKTTAENPEILAIIARDMRIKGMAIDDHQATGDHNSYDYYASRIAS